MAAYNWQTATINSVLYRLINTPADFLAIGDGYAPATEAERKVSMGYNYIVTSDLDFGGANISPRYYFEPSFFPGETKNPAATNLGSIPFTGIFDGNFKRFYNGTIVKATISKTLSGYTGTAYPYLGIISDVFGGTVRNIKNELSLIGTLYSTPGGAIAGIVSGGYILNCSNKGLINSTGGTGGIVGTLSSGAYVRNCYNQGAVYEQGIQQYAGGIQAGFSGANWVSNCYNTGSLSAPTLNRAYGIGSGVLASGSFSYCFRTDTAIGQGTLLTDAFMRGVGSTQREALASASGVGQWLFPSGEYPILSGVSLVINPPITAPTSEGGLFFGAGF